MPADRDAALQSIRDIVGPAGVVDDPAMMPAYLIDERRLYQGEAALIVRPASTDEVAAIVRICRDAGLGIVPQGGNTGYCGGATPDDGQNQVLLSLSRMNKVRDIDTVGFTMTLDAGVVLAKAQDAALEHNLLFPLAMGSQGSCQIGGNLATNAGGLAVLRYGNARDLVLGLEVVLPDGRIIEGLSGLRKDNTGYDLSSLIVGSEGTLGIITAAVVKLFPTPKAQQTAFLAVADAEAACRLLGRARRESGDTVTSFEYLTRFSLELVLQNIDGTRDPLDQAHRHYVLIELSSGQSDEALREVTESILMSGMEDGDIVDGVIADSGAQRDELWGLRENIPESEKHLGGAIKHDVSVTIDKIPAYLRQAPAVIASVAPCRASVYGHIGDGNLHYNLLPPLGEDLQTLKSEHGDALSAAVHDLAMEMGGSFSAEHGIGKLKKSALANYKSAAALDTMRAIKHALDPAGLMNPGKLL
ncbi:MAG: FAD-binding oxidoreductase [Gammaproteobacteria bacterium]|nr:FAD-binding oxidoreductase [Gammaproteobacteria bacterium]